MFPEYLYSVVPLGLISLITANKNCELFFILLGQPAVLIILQDKRFDGGAFTSIKSWQHPNQIQKRADDDNNKGGN